MALGVVPGRVRPSGVPLVLRVVLGSGLVGPDRLVLGWWVDLVVVVALRRRRPNPEVAVTEAFRLVEVEVREHRSTALPGSRAVRVPMASCKSQRSCKEKASWLLAATTS